MAPNTPAGWEALNERQTDLLLEQRKEIQATEAGILNNARTLLGKDATNTYSGLVNPQTLTLFRDQERWKKLPKGSAPKQPVKGDIFKGSTSWAEVRSLLDMESQCDISSFSSPSSSKNKNPTASRLEYKEMKTYGGSPMTDDTVIVACSNCQKPMIPSAFKEHRSHCKPPAKQKVPQPLEIPAVVETEEASEKKVEGSEKKGDGPKLKKRKEAAVVPVEDPPSPSSAGEMSPAPPSDKKPSEKKQKLTKQPKPKPPPRVKGPLDLDKQCGVLIAPTNIPCARSLTCKSHSMSSKRAVEGRSRPYDVLLGMNSRKLAPVKDDTSARLESEMPQAEKEDINMDSDEEFSDLLEAVRSYEPQPLAMRPTTYVRRRNNCLRIRDLFFDALKGPSVPILLPNGSAP